MKSTIIPPIPNLSLAVGREYHLVLSHLLNYSSAYKRFYATESLNGAYIILDNSAHEKKHGEQPHVLLDQAIELGASEIVCPDHLFDCNDTIKRTRESLDFFLRNELQLQGMNPIPRFMIVPQGNTPAEFSTCLQSMILDFMSTQKKAGYSNSFALTIGLSKDYEIWEGGLYRLLSRVIFPLASTIESPQIHLLGWGRDLWALQSIVQDFSDRIRSIDSAKPIVYGIDGISIDSAIPAPEYPRRSSEYFTTPISEKNLKIVQSNIRVFDEVVSGGTNDIRLPTMRKVST